MTENCWLKTLDGTVVRPSLAVRFDVQPDFYDLGRRGSLIVLRVHVNGPRSRDNAATTEALHLLELPSEFAGGPGFTEFDAEADARNAAKIAQLTALIEPLTNAIATNAGNRGLTTIGVSLDGGVEIRRRNEWTGAEVVKEAEVYNA